MTTNTVNWNAFKPTLKCEDLTRIYPYSLRTIRNMAAARNTKIPCPCGTRPFVFRLDDVKRHYTRMAA